MSIVEVYKPKQGKRVRGGTFVGAMILNVLGVKWLSDELAGVNTLLRYGIPTVVFVLIGYVIFWAVYKRKKADFLIATEGEMKKVAWSSRREVIGSTKVVVFATFTLAALLFVVDLVFQNFFGFIGVLRLQ